MLEAQGLKASIAPIPINECGETPGRAISVDPPAGTVVKPGDPVVVRSPKPVDGVSSTGFCTLDTYRRDDAWALIDYAHGRRDKPTTAPGVDLGPLVERLRNWSGGVGRYEQG